MDEFALNIKKLALDAVKESKPSDVEYGTVISEQPLKIQVSQKLLLTEKFLTLSQRVQDTKFNITIEGTKKSIILHNALKNGDKVIMLKHQGGQHYTVIDKY